MCIRDRAYTNRALEAAGHPALVDHRSYKRQGIDKIPSVHLGPAASQMEKRGIRTDKGEVNRQIAADNKLLKEIKARITVFIAGRKPKRKNHKHSKAA